ncbi:MAG: hypothetical protein DCO96_13295 [Fluviicola sp. XM-24bin1]|nr:MAG: hypothetical protein DCO96_13295 [Fluviicola sp. XM-24bin1]
MRGILIITALIFVTLSCVNRIDSSGFSPAEYEETKMTLEEQEKSNPMGFIDIDIQYRKNMWGTFIISGSITNRATIATYKEPVFRFSYYSKTGRLLGNKDKIWDEFLEPGKSLQVEFREPNMSNAQEVRVDLINAKAK